MTPLRVVRTTPALWLLLLGAGSCATAAPAAPPSAGGDASGDALVALGRTVFLELSEPKCGACHVLADAGTSGMIGPDLDELTPTVERVVTAVSGGVGVMRAQRHLTDEQVEAVARYVVQMASEPR